MPDSPDILLPWDSPPNRKPRVRFCNVELTPKTGTPSHARYGGAKAACWVNTTSASVARRRIAKLLRDTDWIVGAFSQERSLGADHYAPGDESLDYFNQALIDGAVCIIYPYPANLRVSKVRSGKPQSHTHTSRSKAPTSREQPNPKTVTDFFRSGVEIDGAVRRAVRKAVGSAPRASTPSATLRRARARKAA